MGDKGTLKVTTEFPICARIRNPIVVFLFSHFTD